MLFRSTVIALAFLMIPTSANETLAQGDDRPSPALTTLVAAERSFSAMSVEKGMRDAFLAFLAESSTIFRPLPMDGREAWQKRGPVPATLIWEPIYAEVSAAGDLGVTTGPWEFRPPPEQKDAETFSGHFISTWRRRPDGHWRVAADIGVNHRKPVRDVPAVGAGVKPTFHEPSRLLPPPGKKPQDLAQLDRGLARAFRSKGVARGFADRATADVRFNLEGAYPFQGPRAPGVALDTLSGRLELTTQGKSLAASEDLGYTYGLMERFASANAKAPSDTTVYLHVWRRGAGGDWRLSLAVWNPLRRR